MFLGRHLRTSAKLFPKYPYTQDAYLVVDQNSIPPMTSVSMEPYNLRDPETICPEDLQIDPDPSLSMPQNVITCASLPMLDSSGPLSSNSLMDLVEK